MLKSQKNNGNFGVDFWGLLWNFDDFECVFEDFFFLNFLTIFNFFLNYGA